MIAEGPGAADRRPWAGRDAFSARRRRGRREPANRPPSRCRRSVSGRDPRAGQPSTTCGAPARSTRVPAALEPPLGAMRPPVVRRLIARATCGGSTVAVHQEGGGMDVASPGGVRGVFSRMRASAANPWGCRLCRPPLSRSAARVRRTSGASPPYALSLAARMSRGRSVSGGPGLCRRRLAACVHRLVPPL